MRTHKGFCRICGGSCAMDVDVEDGRVVAVRGDRDDPLSGGYTCIKGRQTVDLLNSPERLVHALKRTSGGSFVKVPLEEALDDIARQLTAIISRHGSHSVATYNGTASALANGGWDSSQAFHAAINSRSYFSAASIDQPAKFIIAPARHGTWGGGTHDFDSSDVTILIGNNPLISHYAGSLSGLTQFSPSKRLHDALVRGLQLIVIDPRRTETARKAHLHLQVRPGEDPTLLAGLIRVILNEGLHDTDFCSAHVDGVDKLHAAVQPFTPLYVEQRSGVSADLMIEAARTFARGPRGAAVTGTGPNMSPRATLSEHLAMALNTLMGRYKKAGETVSNVALLRPLGPRYAQVIPPWDPFEGNPPMRTHPEIRPVSNPFIAPLPEYPSAYLADEILTPGDGQIRALFSMGGNPVVALPNQARVRSALNELELFVQYDIKMSASAKLATHVLPGRIAFERADLSYGQEAVMPMPYACYSPAIVDPPGDAIEEWELFWELARRLGATLSFRGGALPMDRKPSKDEILCLLCPDAMIPIDQLRQFQGGRIFPELTDIVRPGQPDAKGRLQVSPEGVCEELAEISLERFTQYHNGNHKSEAAFTHLLISRRLNYAVNSSIRYLPAIHRKNRTNPAFMNPSDLANLGLHDGDTIEISSATGTLPAIVESSEEIGPGVISFAHCWGDLPELDGSVGEIGSSVNRLTDDGHNIDRLTGMGIQSALPVRVRKKLTAAENPPETS